MLLKIILIIITYMSTKRKLNKTPKANNEMEYNIVK